MVDGPFIAAASVDVKPPLRCVRLPYAPNGEASGIEERKSVKRTPDRYAAAWTTVDR